MTARWPRSIRARLTLWYGGSVLVVLLAVVALLRAEFGRTLAAEVAADEARAFALVRQIFALEIAEYQRVDATLVHIGAEAVFPDRQVVFLQPDGTPLPGSADDGVSGRLALQPPLRTREEPLDPLRAPGWRLRMTSSEASAAAARRRLDERLRFVLPLVTLLAAAAGWWLTGRTLHPVWRMAEAADAIAGADSGARLPITTPHDELGRLGTSFNQLLDRLDAALAQQRRFLADAAHELRTPIARMRSAADLAQLQPDQATDRAALAAIRADLAAASQLIGELLQLARADADPHAIHREPCYLDDLALETVQRWQPAARQAGVTLVTGDLEETPVQGDTVLLPRLLGVLVDNAIRYSPAGGRVEVAVRHGDGTAEVTVRDQGIGIAREDAERLFDRFYRGAEARRLAPDGSGLGLPIAAWIARAHGGSVQLEPQDGGGTLARLQLPAAPAPPAPPV